MATLSDSGTQSATLTTEHTLTTQTTAGTYVLVVDTANMANGDELELRIYTKVLTGDTSQEAYLASFAHVQGQANKYSVPVPIDIEWKATLLQTVGTGRSFKWAALSI